MTDPASRHRFTAAALAACAGFWVCWTLGPIYIKLLAGPLDVWTQNMARYAVACLFWLPFLLRYGPGGITRGVLAKALVPTAFNLIMQTCWAGAFYYEQPAFMVLLSRTSILWVSLFSLIIFAEERPLFKNPVFVLGALLAIGGLAGVIVCNPRFETAATWRGIALAMGASLSWAAYAVSARIAFKEVDSRLSFSIVTIYTVIGLTVLAVVLGRPADLLTLSAMQVGHVLISGVTAIALGHVFFYAAMRRVGATLPAMINLLTPFSVLVLSAVIFNEVLTARQAAFGALLVIGISLTLRAGRKTILKQSPSLHSNGVKEQASG